MNSIDLFVKNWGNKSSLSPICLDDINTLEVKLGHVLPQTYTYLLSKYGLVRTPNVLTKIIDLNAQITDVQDFLSLEDVFSLTKLYELSGMPAGYVVFASDCKGNMFCFCVAEIKTTPSDVGVWFYEHGAVEVRKVADSFTLWLAQFNALK